MTGARNSRLSIALSMCVLLDCFLITNPPYTKKKSGEHPLAPCSHGSLNPTSSPPGGKVRLSGRNAGEQPPSVIPSLPIGIYTAKLVGKEESRSDCSDSTRLQVLLCGLSLALLCPQL